MSLRPSAELPRLIALLGWAVALVSCWTQRSAVLLPDISSQLSQMVSAFETLEETRAGTETRLNRFTQDREDFFADPQWASGDAGLPLDAFKYIAMTCLNFASDLAAAPPPIQSAAEQYGLGCAPPSLLYLPKVLSAESEPVRAKFVARLQKVDSLRSLAMEIEENLSNLSMILLRGRSYVAEKRSQMRQMELDFRRRDSEFSDASKDEMKERFGEYHQRVDDLERSLDDLEGRRTVWTKRMAADLEAIYSALSLMRPWGGGAASDSRL
jgi:hypothetical protein